MLGKKKVKLLKSLLKEIEGDVELLNKILDNPYIEGDNERRAVMFATNIRCRAEAIEGYIFPRGLKFDAMIDEEWEVETIIKPVWKALLRIEDVEEEGKL